MTERGEGGGAFGGRWGGEGGVEGMREGRGTMGEEERKLTASNQDSLPQQHLVYHSGRLLAL